MGRRVRRDDEGGLAGSVAIRVRRADLGEPVERSADVAASQIILARLDLNIDMPTGQDDLNVLGVLDDDPLDPGAARQSAGISTHRRADKETAMHSLDAKSCRASMTFASAPSIGHCSRIFCLAP